MKVSSESAPRVELHEKLGLTGAEISINTIGAGECVPFIHSHKQNEEIYYDLEKIEEVPYFSTLIFKKGGFYE
jgi:uncharacterized cupin superfamily protein